MFREGPESTGLPGDCQRDAAIKYYLCAMDFRIIMFGMALILVGCVLAKVLLAPTQTPVMDDCRGAGRC